MDKKAKKIFLIKKIKEAQAAGSPLDIAIVFATKALEAKHAS